MNKLLLLFLLVCGLVRAQTPLAISGLGPAGPLTGTELIPAVQPGSCPATLGTCAMTPAQIATYVNAHLLPAAAIPSGRQVGNCTTASASPGTCPTVTIVPGYNVVCDGATDDTVALNTLNSTLAGTGGGTIFVANGARCLVNTANLVLGTNVVINGLGGPVPGTLAAMTGGPGILLNPSFRVQLSNGSGLENISVIRSTILPNASASQIVSAVAAWGLEQSVGIYLPPNTAGTFVTNVFVAGFNTCLQSRSGQFHVDHLSGDCYNGVDHYGGADNTYFYDTRFEPFYSLATSSASGSWARPGIAFNFHANDTGIYCAQCFAFMYANGIVTEGVGEAVITAGSFEWVAASGNGITGAVGMRFLNGTAESEVADTYFNGYDMPISMEQGGNLAVLHHLVVSGTTTSAIFLEGQSATPSLITLSGTVSAGSTASATVTSASVVGSPLKVTATAVAGDTLISLATKLQQAVIHSQPLAIQRFGSFWPLNTNTVEIYWPSTTTATITATGTGGVGASPAATSVVPGSTGSIDNVAFYDTAHLLSVDPAIYGWQFALPQLGNGLLLSNWITGAGATTNNSKLTLKGMPWPGGMSLTGCGSSPSALGTMEQGTVTEGGTTTGCTINWPVPWSGPLGAECVVSSPNGSAITTYGTNTTQLVITNPSISGARYNWYCSLPAF